MEIRPEQIATAPHVAYVGEAFRHMAARWDDPLSSEGARIRGGRFNPPDSFPVLYLCTTRPCTVAELNLLGRRQTVGVEGLLPRALYRYEISLDRVLDLSSEATLEHLGITEQQVTGSDLTIPRQIGESAHATGSQAVRSCLDPAFGWIIGHPRPPTCAQLPPHHARQRGEDRRRIRIAVRRGTPLVECRSRQALPCLTIRDEPGGRNVAPATKEF